MPVAEEDDLERWPVLAPEALRVLWLAVSVFPEESLQMRRLAAAQAFVDALPVARVPDDQAAGVAERDPLLGSVPAARIARSAPLEWAGALRRDAGKPAA